MPSAVRQVDPVFAHAVSLLIVPMRVVSVTTPSRLHFGLINAAKCGRFGGVGLMIDPPRTEIGLTAAEHLQISGFDLPRIKLAIDAWHRELGAYLPIHLQASSSQLPARIEVLAAPPAHRGLGSGTQRMLAVAAGLSRWFLPERPLTVDDALRFGRGRRSAVGTHGFFHGGLIVDGGQGPSQSLGRLVRCLTLPPAWRVLLCIPTQREGPSGTREEALFRELRPTPPELANRLLRHLHDELIPAVEFGDFDRFSRAVFEYGYAAGLQFAAVQAGPYNGPLVERIVSAVREAGVVGVGQSSWGPAVFCLMPDEATARQLADILQQNHSDLPLEWQITQASPRGHQVSERSDG